MREQKNLKDKKRIVFKIGTSTLTHAETGGLDLVKMEKFVRIDRKSTRLNSSHWS